LDNRSKTIQSIFFGFTIISILLLSQNQAEGTDHFWVNFQYTHPGFACDWAGECKIIGQIPYLVENEEVHGKVIWKNGDDSIVDYEFSMTPDENGQFISTDIIADGGYLAGSWYVTIEYNGEYAMPEFHDDWGFYLEENEIRIVIPVLMPMAFFETEIDKQSYSTGDKLKIGLSLDTIEWNALIPITITNDQGFSWSTSETVPFGTRYGGLEKIIDLDEAQLETGGYIINAIYHGQEIWQYFDFTKEVPTTNDDEANPGNDEEPRTRNDSDSDKSKNVSLGDFHLVKYAYKKGDMLQLNGIIHNAKGGEVVLIQIQGKNNDFTKVKTTKTSAVGAFDFQMYLEDPIMKNGDYEVQVIFSKETVSSRVFTFTGGVESNPIEIKPWIKNNAGWWSKDLIGEDEFVSGIQYLIEQEVIQGPFVPSENDGESSAFVPPWIKDNAGWWAEGLVSDSEFVNAIQFLISQGIIVI